MSNTDWLGYRSRAVPKQWLVGRIAHVRIAADDPRVQSIGRQFDRLDPLFSENRRMFANRALQLHQMPQEQAVHESMSETPEIFERARGGNTVGNFGQYTSYYATLRGQDPTHDEAVKVLWSDHAHAQMLASPTDEGR